jgi:lipopolysaccharide export system ATP-binding protein
MDTPHPGAEQPSPETHALRATAVERADAPILRVDNLVKTYGRRKVVDGVGFQVQHGEIVGLLGPNGAGKTTSFRMTCGLIDPDGGTVQLNGIDVTRWPMYRRAREGGMGYLAQESSIFKKLTVEQNLLSMMELLQMSRRHRRQRCQELLDQLDIAHIRKTRGAKVSGGERRRVEIARCLISNPAIILLDEPFAGIDPITVQSIQGIIRDLRRRGIAVLITDHAAREILQIVDRCYVINEGKVLCSGTPDEIKRHEETRRIYLGDLDGGDTGVSAAADDLGPRVDGPHITSRRDRGRGRASPFRRFTSIHDDETLDADQQ